MPAVGRVAAAALLGRHASCRRCMRTNPRADARCPGRCRRGSAAMGCGATAASSWRCAPACTCSTRRTARWPGSPWPRTMPRRFCFNDGRCDRRGRLIVGPMHHRARGQRRRGGLPGAGAALELRQRPRPGAARAAAGAHRQRAGLQPGRPNAVPLGHAGQDHLGLRLRRGQRHGSQSARVRPRRRGRPRWRPGRCDRRSRRLLHLRRVRRRLPAALRPGRAPGAAHRLARALPDHARTGRRRPLHPVRHLGVLSAAAPPATCGTLAGGLFALRAARARPADQLHVFHEGEPHEPDRR